MSEDPDVESIAALLEDGTARQILTETSLEPMSATELSERCDVSEPTIYRRLEDLRECGLVEERTRPDPEGGHHHKVYSPTLERVSVELTEGRLDLQIERRTDVADRFTDLIEGM